jgi:hypothetical protein
VPFPSLVIEKALSPAPGVSLRADVALFVGLVARRPTPVPAAIGAALARDGWAGDGPFARSAERVEALLDVPVPIDSWEIFDRLFAWDARPVGTEGARPVPCALGLAMRSFFAEGGVKAWLVRVGDPLPLVNPELDAGEHLAARRRLVSWAGDDGPADAAARAPLVPGFGGRGPLPEATDPATWTGASHVWGVDEAAMLLLPDLPDLMAGPPGPARDITVPPPPPERFKPCAPAAPGFAAPARAARPALTAPRLDDERLAAWADAVRAVLGMLAVPRGPAHRRDVMLVTSLPLPDDATDTAAWPLDALAASTLPGGAGLLDASGIGSARLQLGYPWVATAAATDAPEGIEGAEGVLAGVIARTSLAAGAFRSAAGSPLASVRGTVPELGPSALRRGLGARSDWLGDRLSLVGTKVGRQELLSDSTMADDRAWRAGSVSRLAGIVLRAGRWLGQDLVFEASGEALWSRLRRAIEDLMERLAAAGAFADHGAAEPFSVRCDRGTMTQNDIDSGRVIAEVGFVAAQPIQQIRVTLALTDARARAREVA